MRLPLPLAVLAAAFLAACAGLPSRRVDDEAKKLSEQLLARSEAKGATVAVIPFRSDQGRISELGRSLSLSMTEELSASRRFVPIEREALCAVMQELSLNSTGVTDPKTSLSLGKMSEARYLVLGTIEPTGPEALDVRVRLIETESGRVAATASTIVPRSGNFEHLFQRSFTSSFCPSEAAASSSAGRPAPVPAQALPSVAGVWRLDEGTGSVAKDASGGDNHGALVNSPRWVKGVSGSALSFDGASQFVRIADSPSLRAARQITVAAWFKANSLRTTHQYIVDKWWDGNKRSYSLLILGSDVYLDLAFEDSNTDHVARLNGAIRPGQWYHAVGTYDGSALKLYLNGALVNTSAYVGVIGQNSAPLAIGAEIRSPVIGFFDGVIDEAKVLNEAMTPEEVAKDYAAGAAR